MPTPPESQSNCEALREKFADHIIQLANIPRLPDSQLNCDVRLVKAHQSIHLKYISHICALNNIAIKLWGYTRCLNQNSKSGLKCENQFVTIQMAVQKQTSSASQLLQLKSPWEVINKSAKRRKADFTSPVQSLADGAPRFNPPPLAARCHIK